MKKNIRKIKIGILGGGQLARMLILKAHELGLNVYVLSPSKNDPAAQVTNQWIKGNLNHKKDLLNFIKVVDIITFESEFVDTEILDLLNKTKKGKVFPSTINMKLLQDRKTQKELLIKSHIATSPFFDIKNYQELLALKKGTNLPLVLKARKNGYDGKGTYILKKWDDLKVKKFLAKQKEGVIAEDFIPFKRELALSICRSRNKDIIFFPLVESKQEAFCCTWVMGPTHHQQLSLLKTKLKNFVINNDYFGFLTFELFDTGKKLIVNEIAPRVHNSGHYSMDALDESQFSAHLKAIIGAKLSDPQLLCQGFAMYNLLGKSTNQPTWQLSPGVKLHWYGKEENYMGRKMGHLNAIADGPNQALNKVKRAIKEFKL